MNSNLHIIGMSILTATSLALTACGGEGGSNTDLTEITNLPHPTFSRVSVRASGVYQPTGEIQNTTPTFYWEAITGATAYTFGHEDADSETRWHDYILSAQEAACTTDNTCKYTPNDIEFAIGDEKVWWVKGKTKSGWQDWSSAYIFTVTDGIIHNPTASPISPEGVIETVTPIFKWTPGNGASHYELGMESENTSDWTSYSITADQANCQSSECSYTPNPSTLNDGDDKTWWVREKISGVWQNWSAGSSFSIQLSLAYIPFANTSNVTSIVEANGNWYGISALGTEILQDDGAGNITTIYTSQYGFDSILSNAISGKLYFVVISNPPSTTPGNGFGSGKVEELHSFDLVTNQDDVLLTKTDVKIENSTMNGYLLVSDRHIPSGVGGAGYPRTYYKVDSNSDVFFLAEKIFGNSFWVESVDTVNNIIHVKIRTIINSTAVYTFKKLTDAVGMGLEDE